MLLTAGERLLILNQLLPSEGDIVTLRVLEEARGVIGLTGAEIERYDVSMEGGRIQWDSGLDEEKEIPLGAAAFGIIADALRKRNEQKKLIPLHVSLYEKFCERPAPAAEALPATPLNNGARAGREAAR